jgi:hypothetical protein
MALQVALVIQVAQVVVAPIGAVVALPEGQEHRAKVGQGVQVLVQMLVVAQVAVPLWLVEPEPLTEAESVVTE